MSTAGHRPMRSTGIAYGADVYPEQWDPDTLHRDIELMAEAGVTVVTLGVFAWARLEPTPGVYHLDWLQDTLDAFGAAGIGVDLATGTASPPPWLGRLHPSTLPVTADGRTLTWGSRQQINPSSAEFRTRAAALVRQLADRVAHHPALVAWHVGNEYGCHVDASYDDESADRFRDWLQRRYGSLDAVNTAWGTTFWSQRYADWSEILPPRATPTLANPHHLDDWRRFSSDMLLELYLLERDILKAANPHVPVTTNFMGLFQPVDYWSWAPHLDFISNDSYPDPANPRAAREFALECDLMRSLGQGRPFVQMEQVTTAVQWRPRNATKRPGQYRLWSTMAVMLGADGILNFQWRQSASGSETFHGAMVPHAGTRAAAWPAVVETGRTLAALAPLQGARIEAHVAILWDWENAWAYDHAVGPTNDPVPETSTREWHGSVFELGVPIDFAHPTDDLTGYRVIIVPSLFRLTRLAGTRLREAAEHGAQIVVTYLTGYVNKHGHAIQGGYLGALSDLLGVTVTDIAPRGVTPTVLGTAAPLDPATSPISAAVQTPATDTTVHLTGTSPTRPWTGAGQTWVETVHVDGDDTAVLVTFDTTDATGAPAITRRRLPGRGAAWYIATDLDDTGRQTVLTQVLQDAGIPLGPPLPPGVQRLRRGGLTAYLNHSDREAVVHGQHIPPRDVLLEFEPERQRTVHPDGARPRKPKRLPARSPVLPVEVTAGD